MGRPFVFMVRHGPARLSAMCCLLARKNAAVWSIGLCVICEVAHKTNINNQTGWISLRRSNPITNQKVSKRDLDALQATRREAVCKNVCSIQGKASSRT